MLKLLRIIPGVIAFTLAIYGLISSKTVLMPYMFFFLGSMFLVTGISEFRLKRKRTAYINFFVSLFVFVVSIQGFLFN